MAKKEKMAFLPFHAVNEFMRDDFRIQVIQQVLSRIENCAPESRIKMNKLMSKGVKVPGFRNSNQAPISIRVKHSQSLFEKSAEFSGVVMDCWSQLHPELKENLYLLLKEEGWSIPELAKDRTKFPGFQLDWPKGQSFDQICKAVRQGFPDTHESDDEISLMVVWVGNRLPINGSNQSEETAQSANSNS